MTKQKNINPFDTQIEWVEKKPENSMPRFAGLIRQNFHELMQSRKISLYDNDPTHKVISSCLDILIEAVGCEMSIIYEELKEKSSKTVEY